MSEPEHPSVSHSPFESQPARSGGPVARQRRGPGASSLAGASAPLEAAEQKVPLPSPYQYVGVLGRGGMGVVYHALDPIQERPVAIKFLTGSSADAHLIKRFQREGNQLSRLQHPNIVAFYEAGIYQKQAFLVMQYVEGGSLRSLLEDNGGPLPVSQVLDMFAAVCDGLDYIHKQGLVHRDLKPDNILLDAARNPHIGDFGLALDRGEEASRLTASGMILGTYSYLAPEQILSRDVGPSADLYAIGCCLYESLTGRAVFEAETEFALLNSHLRMAPVPPIQHRPDLPVELDTLILRLLAKTPGERLETAGEVSRVLRRMAASRKQVWSLPVVGREGVVQELENALRKTLLRQPVAVVLQAAPGLGRSALLRELTHKLHNASIAVQLMVPLPHGKEPAAQLFLQNGGSLEEWQATLARGGPEALATLLWRQLGSREGARVLVVDDLARLPPLTTLVAEAMCAGPPPAGFGWVVAPAGNTARAPRWWHAAQRVDLEPLDGPALRDLAGLQLSATLDDELSEGLLFRASGSVRRLRLWLLALRGAGLLQQQGQMLVRDHNHAWPDQLWQPLWAHLSTRPESEIKFLRVAALLEEPFAFDLAQNLAELGDVESQGVIDTLLRDGLLEECWGMPGELFQFCGNELKEQLLSSSTERFKRRTFGRAAESLESRAPLGLLARYLHSAGQDEEALPKFLQAAYEAENSGDYGQAEQNWRGALRCLGCEGSPEVRLMTLVGCCQNLLRLNRWNEVEATAAEELARPVPESAELKRSRRQLAGLAARARWLAGQRGEELTAFCRSELGQLADSDFSDSLWLTWCWAAGLLEEGHASQGLQVLHRLPERETYPAPYYWLEANLLATQGQVEHADRILRGFLQSDAPRSGHEEVEILLELALLQVKLSRSPQDAASWLEQATLRAHQLGEPELLAEIDWHRGMVHEAQHDLGAALRCYERIVETSRRGSEWQTQGWLQAGVVLCKLDRLDQAESTLRRALEAGSPSLTGDLLLGLGALDVLRGNWDAARERFAAAESQVHGSESAARLMRSWCLWQLGQGDVARSLIESQPTGEDPLENWLRQRLLRVNDPRGSMMLAPPDELPWILGHHPLRAVVGRLGSLRVTEPERPPVPAPAPVEEKVRVVPAPASVPASARSGSSLLGPALVGVGVLALVGLGLQWSRSRTATPPAETPVAVASSSTSSTSSSSEVAVVQSNSATPTVAPTGADYRLMFVVQPKTAVLTVAGEPVALDHLGSGAATVSGDEVQVEARASGYRPYRTEKPLGPADATRMIGIQLVPQSGKLAVVNLPRGGKLAFLLQPAGANLPLKQSFGLSKDPKTGKGFYLKDGLRVGEYKLKFMHPDYEDATAKVTIKDNATASPVFDLRKIPVPVQAPAPVYHQPAYEPPPPRYDPPPVRYAPPPPRNSGNGAPDSF